MAQAYLYFRESGLKRRVLVHGEAQLVDELNAAAGVHLSPKTPEGQNAEELLRRQRGWLMDRLAGIPGVKIVKPVNPNSDDVDFDIDRTDRGEWPEIMSGVSDAIAMVLGGGAQIIMLDGPI